MYGNWTENPQKLLNNIAISVQLPYITGHSLLESISLSLTHDIGIKA